MQLKKVFENATLKRMYKNNGNARFLQCSGNICITGKGNPQDKTYKILQIEINGEKLLDKKQSEIILTHLMNIINERALGIKYEEPGWGLETERIKSEIASKISCF